MMKQFFPGIDDPVKLREVASALEQKFLNPTEFQEVLGFADGGLIKRPTIAALAERGTPELVYPLDRFEKLFRNTQNDQMSRLMRAFTGGVVPQVTHSLDRFGDERHACTDERTAVPD
jgi:SLT domain-containing protein